MSAVSASRIRLLLTKCCLHNANEYAFPQTQHPEVRYCHGVCLEMHIHSHSSAIYSWSSFYVMSTTASLCVPIGTCRFIVSFSAVCMYCNPATLYSRDRGPGELRL